MYAIGNGLPKRPRGRARGFRGHRQKIDAMRSRYLPCNPGNPGIRSLLESTSAMFRSRLADAAVVGCLTAAACFCALNARADEPYAIVAQSSLSSATTGRRPLADRIASANLPIISDAEIRPDHVPETHAAKPGASRIESRIESQAAVGRAAGSRPVSGQPSKPAKDGQVARRVEAGPAAENMAVAAVPVDHLEQHAQQAAAQVAEKKPEAATGVWPFNGKWPTVPWMGSPKTTAQAGGRHVTATSQASHPAHAGHGAMPPQPRAAVAVRKPDAATRPASSGTSASRQTGSGDAAQRTARSSGKGLSDSSPASVTR